MTVAKVSLSLNAELVTEARDRAGSRGLSSYVNAALAAALQRDRLRAMLDEMAAEVGPVPDDALEEVRREWPGPSRRTA